MNSFMTTLEEECISMMAYALANGLTVPPELAEGLNRYLAGSGKVDPDAGEVDPDTGKVLPQNPGNHDGKAAALTEIHNELSGIVKPAKPNTILLLDKESKKGGIFKFMGKVPLIRRMMFVALVSLSSLVTISLSDKICYDKVVKSMFELNGVELLMVQAILLASAALGASFIILYKANSYITAGTYDPKYESSYWVRLIVGLMSGIILTQLIPIDLGSTAAGSTNMDPEAMNAMFRITLALLGGFSANLVYNILNRLVETVQALIIPDPVIDPIILEKQFQDKYQKQILKYQNRITAQAALVHKILMEDGNQDRQRINDILGGFVQEVADTSGI